MPLVTKPPSEPGDPFLANPVHAGGERCVNPIKSPPSTPSTDAPTTGECERDSSGPPIYRVRE